MRRGIRIAAGLSLGVLVSLGVGCNGAGGTSNGPTGDPNKPDEIAHAIALPYPQTTMGVGTLVWGDPRNPPADTIPAERILTQQMKGMVNRNDSAFMERWGSGSAEGSITAKPGPQLLKPLTALAGMDLAMKADLEKNWDSYARYDRPWEEELNLRLLSQAIIRTALNIPGEKVSTEMVVQMGLNASDATGRPSIVYKVYGAEGINFETSEEIASKFDGKLSVPTHGAGSLATAYRRDGTKRLVVDRPMNMAVLLASLTSVTPALTGEAPSDVYTMAWSVGGKKNQPREVIIAIPELKMLARDAVQLVEESIDARHAERITELVKQGTPLEYAVLIERHLQAEGDATRVQVVGDGGTILKSDGIKIVCRLKTPGYLYIINLGSDGVGAMLYPTVGGHDVSFGTDDRMTGELKIPGYGNEPWTLTEEEGTESFLVIGSSTQIPDLPGVLGEFVDAVNALGQTTKSDGATMGFLDIPRSATKDSAFAGAPELSQEELEAEEDGSIKVRRDQRFPLYQSTSGATIAVLTLNKRAKN